MEQIILHPPGTIGLPVADMARFHQFTFSMMGVLKPPGTHVVMNRGLSVARNCNAIVREMEGDWLWLMGDDHVFDNELLMDLLNCQKDVVVPLCWRRTPPMQLVIMRSEDEEGNYTPFGPNDLPLDGEPFQVYAAGTAGMLIKRHVLDAIGDPWFSTTGDVQNEDLELCRKIRNAGFEIWCDPNSFLGHIGTFEIWPAKVNGAWHGLIQLDENHKIFIGQSQVQSAS